MNNSANPSPAPASPSTGATLTILVITGDHVPSFKNRKHSGVNQRTGQKCLYTEPKIKKRMALLESRIESALYSSCQTTDAGMDSACLKRLRTVLSALQDDSLKDIPEFSFGVRRVAKGCEGVEIEIE